jgi:LmbE family N-acetylglucosaminyl deacetylase
MRTISDGLGLPSDRAPRILVVSAHADDAEIGAGATIRRLAEERRDASVTWLVLAAPDPVRAAESRASARRLLEGVAEVRLDVRDLRDGYLPFLGTAPKEAIAAHAGVDPDLVLAPRHDDAHQDHRLVAELIPQVFRRATVLEFEVPKWDGDIGRTNLYIPLSSAQAMGKIDHLATAFPSQAGKDWFSAETFMAVLRLRGMECRSPDGAAEGFFCPKLVVG